jgi:putative PIN family toxin of toxin-antitoxin system
MADKSPPMRADGPLAAPLRVVLDTNVVLDWLLFDDVSARPLAERIEAGRWRWIGTAPMLDELGAVLARPVPDRWRSRAGSVLGLAQRWCTLVQPSGELAPATPRCADPDDQKFIDLAIAQQASLLFTRDTALLNLARHAVPFGVEVVRPAAWASLSARA